jgi:hypothetical protein
VPAVLHLTSRGDRDKTLPDCSTDRLDRLVLAAPPIVSFNLQQRARLNAPGFIAPTA